MTRTPAPTTPRKERTYLVNLTYARFMAWPSGIALGTRRQRGILDCAQDIYFKWRDGSHDRSRIKQVAVVPESELAQFYRVLSRLSSGGYYERTARNSSRLFADKLAIPFPQEQS